MGRGEVGWFSPSGFAYLTADRLGQLASESVLGPLVIESNLVGAPLLYGGLYVELFSLAVLFRPSVHRFWGLGITAIHLGSVLVLGFGFVGNVLLAGVLLIAAPTVTGTAQTGRLRWLATLWRRLRQLPLLALVSSLFRRLRTTR
ncbi:MAG: hypothetical protein AAFY88_19550, partial [Acidobacteriota bacterium]